MTSTARIDSNRRNAQRSTGPRTPEGKAASRRNALKHGLTGAGVVLPLPDEAELERRLVGYRQVHAPRDPVEEQLLRQLVISSLRMDRGYDEEVDVRRETVARATLCWYEDRQAEIVRIAEHLTLRPSVVSKELRRSLCGCQWLHDRWSTLRRVLDVVPCWDEASRSIALDLLGIEADGRTAGRSILDRASAEEAGAHQRALADHQLAYLLDMIEGPMAELDQLERDRAEADLALFDNPKVVRIRRFQNRAFSDFLKLHDRLNIGRAESASDPEPEPIDPFAIAPDEFEEEIPRPPIPEPTPIGGEVRPPLAEPGRFDEKGRLLGIDPDSDAELTEEESAGVMNLLQSINEHCRYLESLAESAPPAQEPVPTPEPEPRLNRRRRRRLEKLRKQADRALGEPRDKTNPNVGTHGRDRSSDARTEPSAQA